MVQIPLTWRMILATAVQAVKEFFFPPFEKQWPHKIEVGRTLAQARMRRLGVEGNWEDYITPGLRMTSWAT